jgi:hypothetical protein
MAAARAVFTADHAPAPVSLSPSVAKSHAMKRPRAFPHYMRDKFINTSPQTPTAGLLGAALLRRRCAANAVLGRLRTSRSYEDAPLFKKRLELRDYAAFRRRKAFNVTPI